jgi:hypothetical protein
MHLTSYAEWYIRVINCYKISLIPLLILCEIASTFLHVTSARIHQRNPLIGPKTMCHAELHPKSISFPAAGAFDAPLLTTATH